MGDFYPPSPLKSHFFEDYVPYQLYSAAAMQGSLDVFLHPTIAKMHSYDIENGTNYLGTLDTYLFCRANKNQTTQQLFIHPNTLTYRLNKIKELFHIDFENYDYLQTLHASIMLWKYQNKIYSTAIQNIDK